jgi:hypothetical protein
MLKSVLTGLLCGIVLAACGDKSPDPEKRAFTECQVLIYAFVGVDAGLKYPKGVPRTRNTAGAGEFNFSWGKGALTDAVSASCGGTLRPLRIAYVTVNGRNVPGLPYFVRDRDPKWAAIERRQHADAVGKAP